jgi:5-methylcytosine-specific restriction protein A
MSIEEATQLLADLEPTGRHRVMDLVADTGIKVDGWAVKRGGLPVANPAASPAYCYEWAFGTEQETVTLCVWHDNLEVDGNQIVYRGNLRRLAAELESRTHDRRESEDFRSRAKSQASRARDFDLRCQDAWRLKQMIRFILLKGERAREVSLGRDSSKVEFRRLDPEPWTLLSYDMLTGDTNFVRGARNTELLPAPESEPDSEEVFEPVSPTYVDQFDLDANPERREASGTVWIRSAQVRADVLARAAGCCEACGTPGFRMANGALYLETHHVIPLSTSGPDAMWNVVAVCANDHRIAHYSEVREDWRDRMIEQLSTLYPHVRERLRALCL